MLCSSHLEVATISYNGVKQAERTRIEEQKRRIEKNRTEQNRTEQNRTEQNREEKRRKWKNDNRI